MPLDTAQPSVDPMVCDSLGHTSPLSRQHVWMALGRSERSPSWGNVEHQLCLHFPIPSCFKAAFLVNVFTHHPLCFTSHFCSCLEYTPLSPQTIPILTAPSLRSATKQSWEPSVFGNGQLLRQSLCRWKSIIHSPPWNSQKSLDTPLCMCSFFLNLVLEETSNSL